MLYCLVGQGHPSEKYEFVNWDDEIPNIRENKNGNQTTNQVCSILFHFHLWLPKSIRCEKVVGETPVKHHHLEAWRWVIQTVTLNATV